MIDTPPEPPSAQEQVIEQKLRDCGLKAGGFTVRYEDELQSIEVVIAPEAGAAPEHFPCIHEAVFPEIVTFADGAMFQRYMAFVGELFRPKVLAEAEAELKKRGMWEGFPRREAFADLAEYARALEVHAGFAPGTMLRFEGREQMVLDPADRDFLVSADFERLARLLVVVKFASARDGFTIGFIGNQKVHD